MTRPYLISATAVLLVALGSYAFGESRLPRGLVGFTTATTTGGSGILTMTELCQAEFPASRMCTSAEILATQSVPALPDLVVAWVLPTFVPTSSTSDGTTSAVFWSRCLWGSAIARESVYVPNGADVPRVGLV